VEILSPVGGGITGALVSAVSHDGLLPITMITVSAPRVVQSYSLLDGQQKRLCQRYRSNFAFRKHRCADSELHRLLLPVQ